MNGCIQFERVNVPARLAFELLRRVELLPSFVVGVLRLAPVCVDLSLWQTTLGGRSREVDVLLKRCRPYRELAWRSVGPAGFNWRCDSRRWRVT